MISNLKYYIAIFGILLFGSLSAATSKYIKGIDTVVAIALDGIREDDARFHFSKLINTLRNRGYYTYWYGKYTNCKTSQNSNVSLPAYANLFTGTVDPRIKDNDFKGKLKYRTLFDVYTNSQLFTSWKPLERIMSNSRSLIKENFYIVSYRNFPATPDDWLVKEAFVQFYLGSQFTMVHFSDADNYAHLKDMDKYKKSIELNAGHTLEIINQTENITKGDRMFIIFTDHSRGNLKNWHSHGKQYPESKYIFMILVSSIQLNFSMPLCDHTAINGIIKAVIPK
jgi:hypothetical protein